MGLLSIYAATATRTIDYGYTVGWHYITEDSPSQAIIMALMAVQSISYVACMLIFFLRKEK
jgi:hypothetical protein